MPRNSPNLLAVVSLFLCVGSFFAPLTALGQASPTITIPAQSLIPHATLFISPSSQTLIEGTTFSVSVYIDTKQNSVNTIDLQLQFPANKLAIVNPSEGKSLIQDWLQPPTYSNVDGTARYTGIIPNGVVTGSGLIVTIAFKALAAGTANIVISPNSSVLKNDGLGTTMSVEFGRATYTITPTPPGGVVVYSPTHPFSSSWYNNNNPVLNWQQDAGVTDFSYVLDNEPNTVPGNTSNATGTTVAFQNLGDGLWYFHIKARKLGVWGSPTHFLMQIDTHSPAEFTPAAEIISSGNQNKILASFFTTDPLSGIDHYEVATLDTQASSVASPAFVQADSPYQVSVPRPGTYRIIIRAFDRAGNVRDGSINITISIPIIQLMQKYDLQIIIALLALVLVLFLFHYFFGHKILRRMHRAIVAIEYAEEQEKVEEANETIRKESSSPPAAQPPNQTQG